MAIVNVKTIPSIAFMVITGYTITNASFKAVDLETLPDRDILSLNYAINNQQLIGQSGPDKTAINDAAAAISGEKVVEVEIILFQLPQNLLLAV